jgi:hypothetical protein
MPAVRRSGDGDLLYYGSGGVQVTVPPLVLTLGSAETVVEPDPVRLTLASGEALAFGSVTVQLTPSAKAGAAVSSAPEMATAALAMTAAVTRLTRGILDSNPCLTLGPAPGPR